MIDMMYSKNEDLWNLMKVIQFLTENLACGHDTVLHRTAYMNVPGLVQYLVEKGASLVELDWRGFTPLQASVTKSGLESSGSIRFCSPHSLRSGNVKKELSKSNELSHSNCDEREVAPRLLDQGQNHVHEVILL